ncbi:MAG: GNAT family N-acetyltransferase [Prevotella sp.]|nr:GNAT family N-acetyltransferase [Prevotella sp.]
MTIPASIRYITPSERSGWFLNRLATLWEASVRATHHFLCEADIENLKPYVTEGLANISHLYVVSDFDDPTAFIGIQDEKIEMLFVSPQHLRKGIGKRLVDIAVRNHGTIFVDVNEQNPEARAFYESLGFVEFGRTETDGQGNPFPIIEMRRKDFHI